MENEALKVAFNSVLKNKSRIKNFISTSIDIVVDCPDLGEQFASYTTKLLIRYIRDKDYTFATTIFNHYVENILPHTGVVNKTQDVGSIALALAVINNDKPIGAKVFHNLLAQNILTTPPDNEILLYNLACYYSKYGEKDNLLKATDLAISQGKKPWQFIADPDFETYLYDEDFIRVLNNHTVSCGAKDDPQYCKIEIAITLSTGEDFYLDEHYVSQDLHERAIPIYELIKPKYSKISLYFMSGRSGIALSSDVAVSDLSSFMHELRKSTKISVGETQVIPTSNTNFSFGIRCIARNKLILFNPHHAVDSEAGLYDHVYIIENDLFSQEVVKLVNSYNCLQNILANHIQRYVSDPYFGQAHNGLRIGSRGNRLISYTKRKQTLQVVIENVSDQPIHLLDNIIFSDGSYSCMSFNLESEPDEKLIDKPEIVLAPNETRILKVERKFDFTNRIKLEFASRNTYPMMCNGQEKKRLDTLASKHFTHIWSGLISHEMLVFTVDNNWQKETSTCNDFHDWIQGFTPDIIQFD